jgi:uncharacterized protein
VYRSRRHGTGAPRPPVRLQRGACVYERDRVRGRVPRKRPESEVWFFDRVLEKYGQSDWTFEPGYPHLDRIVLYEQQIEVMTGKHSEGLYH